MRIVQLTDIHLLPHAQDRLLGVRPSETLNKVLADILRLQRQPDLVIVTGDLTDDGSAAAYVRLRSMLQSLQVKVLVLPGNHDDVAALDEHLTTDQIQHRETYAHGDWGIVCLNSQIVGESHGAINPLALDRCLASAKSKPNWPFIFCFHHTLIKPCLSASCQLEQREYIITQLQKHPNIKLVLAGHTHTAAQRQFGSFSAFTTPSTLLQCSHPSDAACQSAPPDTDLHQWVDKRVGYRILDLNGDGTFISNVNWL